MNTWKKPVIEVQKFEANEYVAACWQVRCTLPDHPDYNGHAYDPVFHTSSHRVRYDGKCSTCEDALIWHSKNNCGTMGNNVVNDVTFAITEINSGYGSLVSTSSNPDFKKGTITWTNTADGKTWHHSGTIGLVDSSHPNRS